ncbi:MAG: AraC family ligand binding domain-containing protein, partial [Planctomycetota bacterium]
MLTSESLFTDGARVHLANHWLERSNGVHTHDFAEVCLLLEGEAGYLLNDREGVLVPGTLQFIRPSDRHDYLPGPNGIHLLNMALPAPLCLDLLALLFSDGRAGGLWNAPEPPTAFLSREECEAIGRRADGVEGQLVADPRMGEGAALLLVQELLHTHLGPLTGRG